MNPSLDAEIAKALPFFRLDGDHIICERWPDKIDPLIVPGLEGLNYLFIRELQPARFWQGEADSYAFIIRVNERRKLQGLSQLGLHRFADGPFQAVEISPAPMP